MTKQRYASVLTYDGTAWAGWQKQAGRATQQGALEAALADLTGEWVAVTGAGRTDAGVHATGQVAHFDISWPGSEAGLAAALNRRLPAAMRVRRVVAVPGSFHARHTAWARSYRYCLAPGSGVPPALAPWCQPVSAALVVPWMRDAAGRFEGVHDFAAFGRPVRAGGTTLRRMDRCRVWSSGGLVFCDVVANAFLRHQVRRMVAVLVDVGRGRLAPEVVTAALLGQPGVAVSGRAPARGLTLTAVTYPPEYEAVVGAGGIDRP